MLRQWPETLRRRKEQAFAAVGDEISKAILRGLPKPMRYKGTIKFRPPQR
jgi:hypothetical protein